MYLIKNFLEWFKLKPNLDKKNHKPPFVSEGQIWWCHLGENVGTEISGKGEKFTRPVIILQKLSNMTYLVLPTSTKIKKGNWYIPIVYKKKEMVVCLHQAKTIDYRRIDDKIGFISGKDFKSIKKGFNNLFIQKITKATKNASQKGGRRKS